MKNLPEYIEKQSAIDKLEKLLIEKNEEIISLKSDLKKANSTANSTANANIVKLEIKEHINDNEEFKSKVEDIYKNVIIEKPSVNINYSFFNGLDDPSSDDDGSRISTDEEEEE